MILPFKGNKKIFGEGRNWLILSVSLLLAFCMWSVMKLSRNYSSYIRYHVEVTSSIPGRTNKAVSEDELVIGAKSKGFDILQNTRNSGSNLLHLASIDPKFFHKASEEGDLFYLLPDDLRQQIQDALGNEIMVESFATDTLYFSFPVQSYKKVPVQVHSVITYKDQFMPMSQMTIKPDSILIYGEESAISQINAVAARTINGKDLRRSLNGVARLIPITNVRFSTEEIFYTLEVGRYVENTLKVPITIIGAPAYANVAIVPQEVTLKYRQAFGSGLRFAQQDFVVGVEYDEILSNDVVKPKIVKAPQQVLGVSVEPKFVECIL